MLSWLDVYDDIAWVYVVDELDEGSEHHMIIMPRMVPQLLWNCDIFLFF